MNEQEQHLYEFGPFRLDTAEGQLWRRRAGGAGAPADPLERVPLTPKALRTLSLLVERRGHVVSKDEFLEKVWAGTFVEEGVLARNISDLRKKLGEVEGEGLYIETVPKRGYCFVAPVTMGTRAEAPPPAPQAPQGPPGGGEAQRRKARAAWLIAGALLAVLLAGFAYRWTSSRPAAGTDSSVRTIAVLPFGLVGAAGEDDDYLGLGMADALITKLSNLRQVAVRPTSAVRKYMNSQPDPVAAGRELNVESVLEGNVQRAGGRIRVTVRLVRVGDGQPLWAETFDQSSADIFDVQDSISKKVTDMLKVQISSAEQARILHRYTEDSAAYELYLKGRAGMARYTKDDTLAAVKSFEEALALDAGNALAHAGLAEASAQMRIRFAPEAEVRGWEERAKEEARRALELDPNLAQAHEAIAAVYRNAEFNWAQTIEESDRALELNPNLDMPHYYRAGAFYHLGLFELVEREVRAGTEVNPANRLEQLRVRGVTALLGGRFAEASALLEEARRLSEAPVIDWYLAQTYYYQGDRERAERMLAGLRGGAQAEQRAGATLASFLAARGERGRAGALLAKVIDGSYVDHHVAYSLGAGYAQLGDRARALKWLMRANETGLPCYPWFERDPLLDPLRGDAEFKEFMRRLEAAWREAGERYSKSSA